MKLSKDQAVKKEYAKVTRQAPRADHISIAEQVAKNKKVNVEYVLSLVERNCPHDELMGFWA